MISKLLPLTDYLYIYQNLEYESMRFLSWYTKNWNRRNLQVKHKLEWSTKAVALFILTLFLIIALAAAAANQIGGGIFFRLIILLFITVALLQLSPIFLVLSKMLLWPFEEYQKSKLTGEASTWLETVRSRYKVRVISINGSFGKTSIKDMLYTLLWRKYRVVKSPKSYNTLISLSRTILSYIKPSTQLFIAEMDAYYPGDIRKISKVLKPDIAVITSVAPQHLERFGSMDSLARAQFEVVENLKPGGILVLNGDDNTIVELSKNLTNKKISWGESAGVDFKVSDIKLTSEGTRFVLSYRKHSQEIILPLLGKHHALNFAAAASIAYSLAMNLAEIALRAKWLLPTPHRLEIKKMGNLIVIDNSYNSNPVSARASLDLLEALDGMKKVIITPGFIELGKAGFLENKEFAIGAAKVADYFFIVGENAKSALTAGLEQANFAKTKIFYVRSVVQAISEIENKLPGGSAVLIENDLPDQYK